MSLETMTRDARLGRPVAIEPGWSQGRATFGGVIGALLVARMCGLLADPQLPLRQFSAALLAPAIPGPVDLRASVLRAGSSVTMVRAELRQHDRLVATADGAFGIRRRSSIELPAGSRLPRPDYPRPESLPAQEFRPGLTPEFFAHVDLRPAVGALPFSGAIEPDFGGWMRFRDPIEVPGAEHLVGLIDAWPPAMSPLLSGPAPMATLTWTIDLFTDVFAAEHFWQYSAHTDACLDGYGHAAAQIWDPSGSLAAISRQVVAVFG